MSLSGVHKPHFSMWFISLDTPYTKAVNVCRSLWGIRQRVGPYLHYQSPALQRCDATKLCQAFAANRPASLYMCLMHDIFNVKCMLERKNDSMIMSWEWVRKCNYDPPHFKFLVKKAHWKLSSLKGCICLGCLRFIRTCRTQRLS